MLTLCCAPDWMKGGAPGDDRLDAAGGRPAARALRRLRRARRGGRAAVPAGRAGAGVERAQGLLPERPEPLGPGGLHGALQRGVPGGEGRPARTCKVGGPYVVLASLDAGRPDASDLRGPWGTIDHRALDVVDYWLTHKVGADFVAVDGNTKTRDGTRPPTRGRRRPEVRGRRPVAAGPHGPADLVGRVLRGRPRRRRGRPGEPGQCRRHARRGRGVRGDGRAGGAAVGPAGRRARRTPRCGPTAPSPTAAARRR